LYASSWTKGRGITPLGGHQVSLKKLFITERAQRECFKGREFRKGKAFEKRKPEASSIGRKKDRSRYRFRKKKGSATVKE